jgi:hypothetical protein
VPDSPATQRDLDRLIQSTTDGFKSVWDDLGRRAHKEDVQHELDTKADKVIVERIDKNVRLIIWIGVLIILGLFTTGAGLIANLVAAQ